VHLEFHADPSCPFSWVAARWLRSATAGTEHTVSVQPLSLGILNEGDDGVPEVYAAQQRQSRRVLRVMERARSLAGDDAATALYFATGERFHLDGDTAFDGLGAAVEALGLPPQVLEAADDANADEPVEKSMAGLRDLLGDALMSPALRFPERGRALAGPLLSAVPDPAASARLLAAVLALADVPEFAQLKAPLGPLTVS
jgi:hypothetical protein